MHFYIHTQMSIAKFQSELCETILNIQRHMLMYKMSMHFRKVFCMWPRMVLTVSSITACLHIIAMFSCTITCSMVSIQLKRNIITHSVLLLWSITCPLCSSTVFQNYKGNIYKLKTLVLYPCLLLFMIVERNSSIKKLCLIEL